MGTNRENKPMKQGKRRLQTGRESASGSSVSPTPIYSGARPYIYERTATNMRATARFRFLNYI